MYASFGGNLFRNSQPKSSASFFGQDSLSNAEYCIGFENESARYATGGYSTGFEMPAVNAAQQRFAPTQQNGWSEMSHQPPPPPPKSLIYGQADSEMSFTNSQNLQYQMLCKMEAVSKQETSSNEASAAVPKAKDEADSKKKEPMKKPAALSVQRQKTLERSKTVGDTLNKDADLKEKMRQVFIDELMKQQEISGTFEVTEGTVKAFTTYSAGDPVATFSVKERNLDLAGKEWDCESDCEYLRKAMKGLGTDEDAIIHVVTTRCNSQRQKLKQGYQTMFGRNLIADLRSELSGDFREAVMACFVKPAHFDAWSIKEAIYGLGTDEETLIEILMTRTNQQIQELKDVYATVVSPNTPAHTAETMLDKDISDDTSGDFKKLLRAAANGKRTMVTKEQLENAVQEVVVNGTPTGTFEINYDKLVDVEKCKKEAKALFAAGEDRWGTDEETFIKIFSVRNYYELRRIWSEYVKITQRDILNSIDRETSGNFRKDLAAIVKNIRCRPMYFAERLQVSMKGLGTADKDLIRVIVTRSEIDMVQIKQCFHDLTKQSLWRWLKDDCSGDYRKLLQGIVGQG